jgi:cytochrome c-type biogenesis protein CcmH/NrfG
LCWFPPGFPFFLSLAVCTRLLQPNFLAWVNTLPSYENWSGLAETYTLQGASEKAAEAWQEVLALEPFDSHAHLILGRIYLAKGLSAEAAKEFDACLYTDPNNAEARAALQRLHPEGSSQP